VDGAVRLIAFITTVLGGRETLRVPGPEGRIGHAEMLVGDSILMLADRPAGGEVRPAHLHCYVEDADACYRRALAEGATSLREPRDETYGDRMAGARDPFGNEWYFATHIEDVSEAEMGRRAAEAARTSA
jgi:PhnB protein